MCELRYTGAQLVVGLERRGKLQLRFAFVVLREILTLGSAPSAIQGKQDMVSVSLQQDEGKESSHCYPDHTLQLLPHVCFHVTHLSMAE